MYKPKILILPMFDDALKNRHTSQKCLDSINQEFKKLKMVSNQGIFDDYIKNQNGKKLKGHNTEHQFKYQMSSGDRIFYTYGRYIDGCPDYQKDAIFIYGYCKHDDQDRQKAASYSTPEEVTDDDYNNEHFNSIGLTNKNKVENFFHTFSTFRQSHTTYVLSDLNMPKSIDDLDVNLSELQSEIISHYFNCNRPLLLLGGAGTGKTIMALHILHDFKVLYPNSRCIYFTQSDALLEKAYQKYKNVTNTWSEQNSLTTLDNVEFKNINEFCREYYKKKQNKEINDSSIFTNTDFYEYAKDNIKKINSNKNNINISPYDLLAEIRGTIKGGLDSDWKRPHKFLNKDFNKKFLDDLEQGNLIKKENNSFEISNFKNINNYKDERYPSLIKQLKNNSKEVDFETHLITKASYKNRAEESSTLPNSTRDSVYSFAIEYQKYLVENKQFDDNDLVMKLLSCDINDEDKYDMILIDEIQDYTELQLYAIFQFAKNYNTIIMSGDAHQIINPTIFDESRIKTFFQNREHNLEIKELNQNFRCPSNIVNLCNIASSNSRKFIAARSADETEKSKFDTINPFLLTYTEDNVRILIDNLIQYPNTAILVPNENTKEELINLYGEDNYNDKRNPIIFTVSEIKGMEYKYVVTYNILSYYNDYWNEIFNGKAKKQTRYRYYFNLFYVAITRSQQFLCIIEKEDSQLIHSFSNNDVTSIDKTDSNALQIDNLTHDDDDWLNEAEKQYKEGNYDIALQKLNKIQSENLETKQKLELQCNMQISKNKGNNEDALKYAVLLNETTIMKSLCKYANINEDLQYLASILISPQNLLIENNLSEIVERIYKTPNDQNIVFSNIFSSMGDYIFDNSLSIIEKNNK